MRTVGKTAPTMPRARVADYDNALALMAAVGGGDKEGQPSTDERRSHRVFCGFYDETTGCGDLGQ